LLLVSCNVKSQKVSLEVPITVMDVKSVIEFEAKIKSKKEDNSFATISLGQNLYPYVSNYSLNQPYEFVRTKSNLHINPKCEYFFDSKTEELKFFTIKWELKNEVDFLKLKSFSEYTDLLEEDLKYKKDYKDFFNSLKLFLKNNFGEPIKHNKIEPLTSEHSAGESLIWENEFSTINTSFHYPQGEKVGAIVIKYTIYWK
jgi:hypothetical protein